MSSTYAYDWSYSVVGTTAVVNSGSQSGAYGNIAAAESPFINYINSNIGTANYFSKGPSPDFVINIGAFQAQTSYNMQSSGTLLASVDNVSTPVVYSDIDEGYTNGGHVFIYQFNFTIRFKGDGNMISSSYLSPPITFNAYFSYRPLTIVVGPAPIITPVTLQMALGSDGLYKPQNAVILPKYKNGTNIIRANYNTSLVGVIRPTADGGFMIYQEVGGNPSGNLIIYNADRSLNTVEDASKINYYI